MSNDPFNIVKEELKKSINKTKSLIESYQAVVKGKANVLGDDDVDSGTNSTSSRLLAEIRTILKSINWDVQDLEETIKIASNNPARFNLSNAELESRSQFVEQAKEFVQKTRQTFNIDFDESTTTTKTNNNFKKQQQSSNANINIRIPDLISTTSNKPVGVGSSRGMTALGNDDDNSDSDYDLTYARSNNLIKNNGSGSGGVGGGGGSRSQFQQPSADHHAIQMQHQELFREQDKSIDLISGRVSSLKNISQAMQNELDDQAELLDDLGREMETADSRMNIVMKRITKVLHMSSDKRQWTMIGLLLLGIFVLLILFAIL